MFLPSLIKIGEIFILLIVVPYYLCLFHTYYQLFPISDCKRRIISFLCSQILYFQVMQAEEITFNDLPMIVSQLRDEVMQLKQLLIRQQAETRCSREENRHKPMSAEEAADYLRMPIGTLYMKLANGSIPATKPGKRYVLYQDELDKWLETSRKNSVPLSPEEQNSSLKNRIGKRKKHTIKL